MNWFLSLQLTENIVKVTETMNNQEWVRSFLKFRIEAFTENKEV